MVIRYAYENFLPPTPLSEKKLSELINNISFENLMTGKTEFLAEIIKGKNTLINLSISTCMTCPETVQIRFKGAVNKDRP